MIKRGRTLLSTVSAYLGQPFDQKKGTISIIIMEDKILLTAKILGQTPPLSKSFLQLERRLKETPILTLVYEEPIVNQQEMEDYHQSFSTMVYHLYATLMGNTGLISSNTSPCERKLIDTIFLQDDDPKEVAEETIDKKDTEIVETSENINFPDFPTYPPEDDVYIEPDETVSPE